jgi:hypothetical protein
MVTLKAADHALIAVKAALNAVPVVGGSIASLIGDYVPLSTERSIARTIEILSEKLASLESRLDVDSVDKEEFSELFKSCYLVIVRTHQEAKLRAAASILANLLLARGDAMKVPYTELDHLIRCLDALSIGAITTLGAAKRLANASSVTQGQDGEKTISFEQLRKLLPDWEQSLLMGLVSELSSHNLLRIEGRPAIVTAELGNYPLTLTALGERFVSRFIEGETGKVA